MGRWNWPRMLIWGCGGVAIAVSGVMAGLLALPATDGKNPHSSPVISFLTQAAGLGDRDGDGIFFSLADSRLMPGGTYNNGAIGYVFHPFSFVPSSCPRLFQTASHRFVRRLILP